MSDAPPALQEVLRYPLFTALRERRTRRVARGTSVPAGELSYESDNPPAPLTPLEEAILVVATGLTGLPVIHDVPTDNPGRDKELGTPLLNVCRERRRAPTTARRPRSS